MSHGGLLRHSTDPINNENTRSTSSERDYADIYHVGPWCGFNWDVLYRRFGIVFVTDVKLNPKWDWARWHSSSLNDHHDFRQVLAQVNYYMGERRCKYAVVTEDELVNVYQIPNQRGALKVSEPFPRPFTGLINTQLCMSAAVALLRLVTMAQSDIYIDDQEDDMKDVPYDDDFATTNVLFSARIFI